MAGYNCTHTVLHIYEYKFCLYACCQKGKKMLQVKPVLTFVLGVLFAVPSCVENNCLLSLFCLQ